MKHRILPGLFVLLLVAQSCASAGKRLEQGIEAETAGSYYEAAIRYIEALEKDASLAEARGRLREAGDSAIVGGTAEAAGLSRLGDPVGAAGEFLRIDGLLARARGVGVRLPTPAGYAQDRRNTFDDAIDASMKQAELAAAEERWGNARRHLALLRRDFDPSEEQRGASELAEANLLVDWAWAEQEAGRFRRSYDLAGEATEVVRPVPADLVDRAEDLRSYALANGSRALAIFPVTTTAPVRERMERDLENELADILELDYWRAPPLFVVLSDPVVVRQVTRELFPRGTRLQPGTVVREVGADFGVLIELSDLVATERNVRRTPREARTRDGRTTSYLEERGTMVYTLEARVTVVDDRGRNVVRSTERSTGQGSFERGEYRGDVRELELSRGELRLFDPAVIVGQLAEAQQDALGELAERVADEVFSGVLARIP